MPMTNVIKDIGKVRTVLERVFPLSQWKNGMADSRKRPQVSAGTIAQVVVEMVARGQKSLLEADQAARLPEMLAYHGSNRRMVVSDTTIERSLRGFDLGAVHGALWELGGRMMAREGMKLTLPSGREALVGIVDGSAWGRDLGSVLLVSGDHVDAAVGYRMSRGRGHELETTRALLSRAAEVYGRGWLEYAVADGLYMTEEDFRRSLNEWGHHMELKTTEETQQEIQDARGLFFGAATLPEGVEVAKGFDAVRGEQYEVIGCAGFQWRGLKLKVAYVREKAVKPRKGREEEAFWVLTTDETLSLEDMRFVAHRRWHVENEGFRTLNQLVASKRRLTHNAVVREALLGLWLIGLDLFVWYVAKWGRLVRSGALRTVKRTLKWFARMFERLTWQAWVLEETG
jgi:hypothetical protein